MSNDSLDLQAIAQRLDRLEKQNRRLKGVGIIALLMLASFVLMGQAATKQRLEANEFILRDAEGKISAALLSAQESGSPAMLLYDGSGLPRLILGLEKGGSPILIFNEKSGKPRIRLALSGEGSPSAEVLSADGSAQAGLTLDSNGSPFAFARNGSGDSIALQAHKEGAGLAIWHGERQLRGAFNFVAEQNTTTISFFDAEGKVLWRAPLDSSVAGSLRPTARPRVLIEEWMTYGSGIFEQRPERSRQTELDQGTRFTQRCHQAVITIDEQNADYVLQIEGRKSAPEYPIVYHFSLFKRDGTQIGGTSDDAAFDTIAQESCQSVMSDWQKAGRTLE